MGEISRLVCRHKAEILFSTNLYTTLFLLTFFSGAKIIGWWLIINSAPISFASSTTEDVMSRATRTLVTVWFLSPTRIPQLSKSAQVFIGAKLSV